MNDDAVRDFCFLRLPEDSPLYKELHEEFTRDPVNSRVGRFCHEAERVVRCVSNDELDWEGMLLSWHNTETESAEGVESSTEIGNVLNDHVPEIDSGSMDDVGLSLNEAALSTPRPSNSTTADDSAYRWGWWKARSTRITVGAITASLLLLSIGINGWLVFSRSVERERLGFALSVLAIDSQTSGGGSSDIRRALEIVEQSLGRNHPTYRVGQEQLHFALSNREHDFATAKSIAIEIAADSKGEFKAEWLMHAARDARLAGQGAESEQLLLEAANSSRSFMSSCAWEALSQLSREAGNLQEAVRFQENAARNANDDMFKSHMNETLATLYVETEQWVNARLAITSVMESNSRNGLNNGPFCYEILAHVAHELHEPKNELAERQRLIASIDDNGFPRDSRYASSITKLANVEFGLGDIHAAEKDIRRALEEFERIEMTDSIDFAESLVLAARLENTAGKYEAASRITSRAVEVLVKTDEGSSQKWHLSEAYGELAESQLNLGDFLAAEKAALAGLELSRSSGFAEQQAARWLNLSGVSVASGRFEEAQSRIFEAEAVAANYSVLVRQSLLASVHAGLGRNQEAAIALEQALLSVTNDEDRAVLELQLAGVLEKISGREVEAKELLVESKQVLSVFFPGRLVTYSDVATLLRNNEKLEPIQKPYQILFPQRSDHLNFYFA